MSLSKLVAAITVQLLFSQLSPAVMFLKTSDINASTSTRYVLSYSIRMDMKLIYYFLRVYIYSFELYMIIIHENRLSNIYVLE